MTTLTNKFFEVTNQLQQLTIWRPSEREPLIELDRWRTDAHKTIEQIFNRRKHQIEQLTEKHEREFIRQMSRQRVALNNVREKLATKKEANSHVRAYLETSILNDLQSIEKEITVRLGRAEIIIETTPFDFEDSVTVGIKTYLSSKYTKEMLPTHQSQRPPRRSANQAKQAYNHWLETKNQNEADFQRELQSARRQRQITEKESQSYKKKGSDEAFKRWVDEKTANGAFIKKKLDTNDSTIKQAIEHE